MYNDPLHTPLVASGIQLYEIATPKDPPESPTTIVRIESEVSTGHVGTEIGRIEHHDLEETRLRLSSSSSCMELRLSRHPDETTGLEK